MDIFLLFNANDSTKLLHHVFSFLVIKVNTDHEEWFTNVINSVPFECLVDAATWGQIVLDFLLHVVGFHDFFAGSYTVSFVDKSSRHTNVDVHEGSNEVGVDDRQVVSVRTGYTFKLLAEWSEIILVVRDVLVYDVEHHIYFLSRELLAEELHLLINYYQFIFIF